MPAESTVGQDRDRVWAEAQLRPSLQSGTIQGPFSEQGLEDRVVFLVGWAYYYPFEAGALPLVLTTLRVRETFSFLTPYP